MTINSFNDFYDSVALFNDIAGNLTRKETAVEAMKALEDQFARVREEAQEGVDGAAALDLTEVLDGVIDSIVTAFGALAMLHANFPAVNVGEAITRVCKNNLTKFTPNMSADEAQANIDHYAAKGETVTVQHVTVDGVTYGVVRRVSDNKVMKPVGYEAVSLEGCL